MGRTLRVEVLGDASSLERTFRRATVAGVGFGNSLTHLATHVGSLVGGLYVLHKAIHAGITELEHHQQVAGQTNAVLKSTGQVAGVTSKHLEKLAMDFSNLSGVNDELAQQAGNVLLGFTNIRNAQGKNNNVFDQAFKVLGDYSVRMGKDMPTAATILGKALQNPLRGMGGLSRAGIVFDDVQRKTIKSMVTSGHLLDAQKYILAELRKRYEGAAAAAGKTFAGQVNILRERVDDLLGTMTGLVSQALLPYIQRATAWIQSTKNQKRVMDLFKQALEQVKSTIHTVVGAFQSLLGPAKAVYDRIGKLKGVLVALISLKVAGYLNGLITPIGAVGNEAGAAATKTAALGTALGRLARIGAIAIGIDLIFSSKGDSTAIGAFKTIGGAALIGGAIAGPPGAVIAAAGAGIAKGILDKRKDNMSFGDALAISRGQPVPGLYTPAAPLAIPGASSAVFSGPKRSFGSQKGVNYNLPPVADPNLGIVPPGGGGGGGGSKEPAWKKALERLHLAFDRAGLTPKLNDDVLVMKRIITFLKQQLSIHKNDLDLQQELVSAQSQMLDLRKQEKDVLKQAIDDMRGQALALFGGPVLSPTDDQIKRRLGVPGPDVGKLTRDLKASNAEFSAWQANLAMLSRRGAPKQLIDELRGMGLGSASQVAALAHAGGPALQAFIAQYKARERQITKAAKVEIQAQQVVIRTGGAGGNTRPPDRGQVKLDVYLDGEKVSSHVTKRQQRAQRQTAAQVRGRVGGIRIF